MIDFMCELSPKSMSRCGTLLKIFSLDSLFYSMHVRNVCQRVAKYISLLIMAHKRKCQFTCQKSVQKIGYVNSPVYKGLICCSNTYKFNIELLRSFISISLANINTYKVSCHGALSKRYLKIRKSDTINNRFNNYKRLSLPEGESDKGA